MLQVEQNSHLDEKHVYGVPNVAGVHQVAAPQALGTFEGVGVPEVQGWLLHIVPVRINTIGLGRVPLEEVVALLVAA